MAIYLGNNEVENYINNSKVDTIMPYDYIYPAQYWNVKPCGSSSPITQLAIHYNPIAPALIAGYAVRPVVLPFSTVRLPGYETGCWELVSTATSGIECAILAPAVDCAQSVCL
jgi:hypothetical protein